MGHAFTITILCHQCQHSLSILLIQLDEDEEQDTVNDDHRNNDSKVCPPSPAILNAIYLLHHVRPR